MLLEAGVRQRRALWLAGCARSARRRALIMRALWLAGWVAREPWGGWLGYGWLGCGWLGYGEGIPLAGALAWELDIWVTAPVGVSSVTKTLLVGSSWPFLITPM